MFKSLGRNIAALTPVYQQVWVSFGNWIGKDITTRQWSWYLTSIMLSVRCSLYLASCLSGSYCYKSVSKWILWLYYSEHLTNTMVHSLIKDMNFQLKKNHQQTSIIKIQIKHFERKSCYCYVNYIIGKFNWWKSWGCFIRKLVFEWI